MKLHKDKPTENITNKKIPSVKNTISETIRRETFIFRTYIKLLVRNFKKYSKITSIMYFLPIFGFYPSMKPSYFFCRKIDDIADGDIPLPKGMNTFQELHKNLIATINNTREYHSSLELILIDAINKLEKVAQENDNIKQDFLDFLEAMFLEHNRRYQRKKLSKDELDILYDKSFASVINLALIGAKSNNRISDISVLGRLQGKIYAIEDLENELSLGIINIPKEIIDEAGITSEFLIQFPKQVFINKIIKNWIKDELLQCKKFIEELRQSDLDLVARKMVNFLINPLEKYIETKISISN